MADNYNYYGVATYGNDTYGDIAPAIIVIGGDCLSEQPGFCPVYTRFQFSGVNLGLYIFEINPTSYDIYPQRASKSYTYINEFSNIIDADYNKLEISIEWANMPESMWNSIKTYSRKKVDGRSEDLYFWDANMGRFCGRKVKIEEFSADLKGGWNPINRFSVSLKLREV